MSMTISLQAKAAFYSQSCRTGRIRTSSSERTCRPRTETWTMSSPRKACPVAQISFISHRTSKGSCHRRTSSSKMHRSSTTSVANSRLTSYQRIWTWSKAAANRWSSTSCRARTLICHPNSSRLITNMTQTDTRWATQDSNLSRSPSRTKTDRFRATTSNNRSTS